MHGVVRRALAALLMGALAGLVAGCAEDHAAPSEPIWTTTGTPTPTKPSTPSATPKKETIEEFLMKWGDVNARMENSGETKEFERLTGDKCISCNQLIQRISGIYQAGGEITSTSWRIKSVDDVIDQGSTKVVLFTYEVDPSTYTEQSGGEKRTLTGGQARLRAELARAGESWTIVDYSGIS